MTEPIDAAFGPVETEVLTASCTVAGAVVHRNDAWQQLLGRGDLWQRLAPPDVELAEQRIQEAGCGSLVTNEVFMVQPPTRDEPVPVLLNFLPVHEPPPPDAAPDAAPQVTAVVVTGEAMMEPSSWTGTQTKRHRLESLGRMTMGMVHDFNNLLSGVLGYTELLLNEINPQTPAEAIDVPSLVRSLQTIQTAADDGSSLIEKIQEYIRQEKRTRFEAVDLPTILQDCLALTRPYWYNEPRRQGIAIELQEDLQPTPAIMGSAVELREVFINLILNAVHAMPKGGMLTVKTFVEEDQGVMATIGDDGVGMSPSVQEKIFEPLYTTKGDEGSGMGLAVAYGIVQEHDGTVDVSSELGAGTTFRFAFPLADRHAEPEEVSTEAPAQRPVRVLVVDDEEMVRSVLQRLLSLRGHDVTLASSGAEALQRAREQSFDVVFADQAMPVMNGRQFARHLREDFPDLPIVLLTGDTDISDPEREFDVVLSKPFKLDVLEATIQEVV